ncbi:4a-hydroxytetrahydrobiopterin dehydratase [Streptomyces sp. B1866]|uniref:4a-hydroxytetrahydrobiopterin dehydratase n=1 Tax=Streptomyces sp. B1866 TaxID=3075431 RepID=UPI00289290F1|nr:4a-hydroxytetrahydrobiopterin dehydratase [Streptomyces sp. B1866]MDT3398005.1 4a-hydroxytetrahydrobiopterin dehydratase [Streptomyces sp. B1866]
MAAEPLAEEEIAERLAELPGWSRDGERIHRKYLFDGHRRAAALVARAAEIQEELNHHSDLTLGFTTVTVSVTTHSAGGRLTERDFALARRLEEAAAAEGAHAI